MWLFLLLTDDEPPRRPWWLVVLALAILALAAYLGWHPHAHR